jgi:hypothetical protein
MDYKIELTEELEQPVLSMCTVTSVANLPQELGKAYHAIINYLEQKGLQPSGPAFTHTITWIWRISMWRWGWIK